MVCFSKSRRLLTKQVYAAVFKTGKSLITPEFIVIKKKNDQPNARLGFAIAKKKIPLACQRNRIKRLLRESFREVMLPTIDVIFLPKYNLSKRSNVLILKNIAILWETLTIFYEQ